MIDGLRLEEYERGFIKFYLPKIILLGIFWILVMIIISWTEYNEEIDPFISTQNKVAVVIELFILLVIVIYTFWLSYSVLQACNMDNKKAFLKRRLRFFLLFTILIVVILSIGFLFDVYVHPQNAAEFLSFHALCNLYVYTLAFVYLPSVEAQGMFQKNFEIAKLEDDEDNVTIDFNEPKPKPPVTISLKLPQTIIEKSTENTGDELRGITEEEQIKIIEQIQNLDESDTESI